MIKVGNKSVQWRGKMTIQDLLKEIGDCNFYPVARINNKPVSNKNFAKTFIPDNSEVFLIQMIAGG